MYISLGALQRANQKDLIRLAHYAGLASNGRTIEEIIEELHFKINYC